MRYGDKIILSFSFDEMFEIVLTEGGRFDCRYGEFEHSQFVGQPFGIKVHNNRNNGFVIPLKFCPTLHTESLKRRT